MTTLRKEIFSYINTIPDDKLEAFYPLFIRFLSDEIFKDEPLVIETDLTKEELAELEEAGEEYRKNPASIIPLEAVLKEEYQI